MAHGALPLANSNDEYQDLKRELEELRDFKRRKTRPPKAKRAELRAEREQKASEAVEKDRLVRPLYADASDVESELPGAGKMGDMFDFVKDCKKLLSDHSRLLHEIKSKLDKLDRPLPETAPVATAAVVTPEVPCPPVLKSFKVDVSPLDVRFTHAKILRSYKSAPQNKVGGTILDSAREMVEGNGQIPGLNIEVVWFRGSFYTAATYNRRLCLHRLLAIYFPERFSKIQVTVVDISTRQDFVKRLSTQCQGEFVKVMDENQKELGIVGRGEKDVTWEDAKNFMSTLRQSQKEGVPMQGNTQLYPQDDGHHGTWGWTPPLETYPSMHGLELQWTPGNPFVPGTNQVDGQTWGVNYGEWTVVPGPGTASPLVPPGHFSNQPLPITDRARVQDQSIQVSSPSEYFYSCEDARTGDRSGATSIKDDDSTGPGFQTSRQKQDATQVQVQREGASAVPVPPIQQPVAASNDETASASSSATSCEAGATTPRHSVAPQLLLRCQTLPPSWEEHQDETARPPVLRRCHTFPGDTKLSSYEEHCPTASPDPLGASAG